MKTAPAPPEGNTNYHQGYVAAAGNMVSRINTITNAQCEPVKLNHMTKPWIAPLTKGKCVPATGKKTKVWIVWTEEK
jgi:hypothetical protein